MLPIAEEGDDGRKFGILLDSKTALNIQFLSELNLLGEICLSGASTIFDFVIL